MSSTPDGWSVDVQGPKVVVTFQPGDETGRRSLTTDEARVLWEQLGLAHLLAGRNKATEDTGVDDVVADAGSGSPLTGDALHLEPVDVSDEYLSKLQTEFRARRRLQAEEDQAWVDDISEFNDADFDAHQDVSADGFATVDQDRVEKRADRVEDQAAPPDEQGETEHLLQSVRNAERLFDAFTALGGKEGGQGSPDGGWTVRAETAGIRMTLARDSETHTILLSAPETLAVGLALVQASARSVTRGGRDRKSEPEGDAAARALEFRDELIRQGRLIPGNQDIDITDIERVQGNEADMSAVLDYLRSDRFEEIAWDVGRFTPQAWEDYRKVVDEYLRRCGESDVSADSDQAEDEDGDDA